MYVPVVASVSRKRQIDGESLVERCSPAATIMACSKYGHSLGFLLYFGQRLMPGDFHARFDRAGRGLLLRLDVSKIDKARTTY